MKVKEIRIHNILGIESLEIKPQEITRIEGKNGEGKTSAIEAIKAVVQGGHDATLLRQGAEAGEIVFLLDDGMEIKKRVTAKDTTLTMKHPDFGTLAKPQTRLDKLADALSVNPIEFLTAPAAKRAEYLLQAMPITLKKEDLVDIYDGNLPGANGLENLALLQKKFYDERTVVNRQFEEKKGTISQLEATLPPEEKDAEGKPLPPVDWITRGRTLLQQLNAKKEALRDATNRLEATNRENKNTIARVAREARSANMDIHQENNNAIGKKRTALDTEYNRRLDEVRSWYASERGILTKEENDEVTRKGDVIAVIQQNENTANDAEAKRHAEEVKTETEPIQAEINQLDVDEKTAAQRAKDSQREAVLRQTVQGHKDQLQGLEDQSSALTKKLERIEALRKKILSELPIPGVSVREGQIYREEIPFDRLNTAQQIEIAVAVAKLRAREIGIVCVDGLECLDEKSLAEFENMMKDTGLQVFVTRVTNKPFEVTTK